MQRDRKERVAAAWSRRDCILSPTSGTKTLHGKGRSDRDLDVPQGDLTSDDAVRSDGTSLDPNSAFNAANAARGACALFFRNSHRLIGAGMTGTTTAYNLAWRGCKVTLFDKPLFAAMETSFANGGQLSASKCGSME
jgi:hypothetical protein